MTCFDCMIIFDLYPYYLCVNTNFLYIKTYKTLYIFLFQTDFFFWRPWPERQGRKLLSCSHRQKELSQQESWLLIGCTRVNNQSEARTASWPNSLQRLQLKNFHLRGEAEAGKDGQSFHPTSFRGASRRHLVQKNGGREKFQF